MKRFQPSQCNKIKEHFAEQPYYKLCKSVFEVFQEACPTMVMTPEQLFADAIRTLDSILATGDASTNDCKSLWTSTYNEYREQVGTASDKEDTKTEVAMLFYMVMYGVMAVNNSHYRGTLQRTLHEAICKFYGREKCLALEAKLRKAVNTHTQNVLEWMAAYFTCTESLSKEIDSVLHPAKREAQRNTSTQKEKVPVLYTLNYLCEDESLRIKRIGFVRRKWEEWEWLEANTDVADFEHFFSGKPRDCQLKWKASNAILSLLLAQLLDKKECFGHITGCNPRSVVMNQFKKGYDKHKNRVDDLNRLRIEWTVKLLNYNVSLELPQLPYRQGEDLSDNALQEVFAGNMHITKDLNKYKD